ncbi:MAG: hypothetical protein ABGX16_12120 [Pirellulales bacterium]
MPPPEPRNNADDVSTRTASDRRKLWFKIPADWDIEEIDRFGPWITQTLFRRQDGKELEWNSRRHRKGFPLREIGSGGETRKWWARWLAALWLPHRIGWWIGVLFMFGSLLFALSSFPGANDIFDKQLIGLLPFIGAWGFTSAAFLQYLEAAQAPDNLATQRRDSKPDWWAPQRIDWSSTFSQFVGTLAFNFMTTAALFAGTTMWDQRDFVWSPNVLGSILFLLSGILALFEVLPGSYGKSWHSRDLRITFVNLLGCILFMVSAIAAWVLPDGLLWDSSLANLTTFLGALCFFLGALWLLPEQVDAIEQNEHVASDIASRQMTKKVSSATNKS